MERVVIGTSIVLVAAAMCGVAFSRGPALFIFCTLGQLATALAGVGAELAAGTGLEGAARQVVSAGAALILVGLSLSVLGREAPAVREGASNARGVGLPTLGLALGVFSLAGLPPTDGFFSKILIYESGIQAGSFLSRSAVVLVALFSLIWLVRGIELIADARRQERIRGPVVARRGEALALVFLMCVTLVGGLFPGIFSQVWGSLVGRR